MIRIRKETAADVDDIRPVNDSAFGQLDEGRLVDALRGSASPFLSLVAEDRGRIVGHICFTPVAIVHDDGRVTVIAGLAPMAVVPERQREGIGSALVEAGLEECRRAGFRAVVVVGHPEYYPRFGFEPAVRSGLTCEYDVPDPVFMLAELVPGAAADLRGLARYHEAFGAVT